MTLTPQHLDNLLTVFEVVNMSLTPNELMFKHNVPKQSHAGSIELKFKVNLYITNVSYWKLDVSYIRVTNYPYLYTWA